ncbi:MAG: ABC transporter permease [Candidatus Aminicenantaceae bacterium]
MWFYMKLSWRNILRNKRRTAITCFAIGIGLASLIIFDALIIGMENNLVKSATASFLGEAQIHRKGFRMTHEIDKTIQDLDQVVSNLKEEEIVSEFSKRTMSFGMIRSPANFSSIMVYGIEPEKEKQITRIDDAMNKGEFLKKSSGNSLIIGRKLAETLEVSLNDRVVITVSQAKTGDLSQNRFRVSGIYSFGVKDMDKGMAFIPLEEAQNMLAIGDRVHEIAIKFQRLDYAAQKDLPVWEKYSQYGNEMASWTELMPDLSAASEYIGFALFFFGIILFAIVTFGIINSLFMSLYERIFEFGVLRAVGTRPSGIRKIMVFEAGALSIVSIVIGSLMGLIGTYIFTKTGIDYRGIEFAGATAYELIYPVLSLHQFIIYPAAVFLFTLVIGLYPAVHASRMSVTEALRKSL